MSTRLCITFVAASVLNACLANTAKAQDSGENAIILTYSYLDSWRGEIWQKGAKLRCKKLKNASRGHLNNEACKMALECFRESPLYTSQPSGAKHSWQRVNIEPMGFYQGNCTVPTKIKSEANAPDN